MTHRIERDEGVARGVRRIVRRELDDAVAVAGDARVEVDERIHEVRLCLKRARSALDLVARAAGRSARREDRALRDIGRALAPARDRAVARHALKGLTKQLGTRGRSKLGARLAQALSDDGAADGLAHAARAIAKARRSVARFHVAHGRRAIADGFERAYKRARRAYRAVQTDDDASQFHEWRKTVKRLRYQVLLLGDAAPSLLGAMEPLLDRLGKELGELHDVVFLSDAVTEAGDDRELRAERDRWLAHLERRAQTLRVQTRALGATLFADKPSAVRRRVATSWQRWRAPQADAKSKAKARG